MTSQSARPLQPEVTPTSPRSGWSNLAAKALLVGAILLLMSVANPLTWFVQWGFLNPIPAVLLLWGFLLVGIASSNLFEGSPLVRFLWSLLALGAYAGLTIPGVLAGPERTVEALAPVAALTLAAHLGRRDLQRALRDWALVIALAIYGSLGIQSMWLVVNTFGMNTGPYILLVAVLLPPLIFEAALIVIRRVDRLRSSPLAYLVGLLLSTALAVGVFSATMLNAATELVWRAIFGVLVGVLIGGALLVGLLTRPLAHAASGARAAATSGAHPRSLNLPRLLVELSHDPILIALALYIPLRLLSFIAASGE